MKNFTKVLIVGRPNVGKSTLMNRLVGGKKAITAKEPGVTRDIRSYPVEWQGKQFMLLDSGGIYLKDIGDQIQSKIETLVERTLGEVDKIIFLTDAQDGVHAYDMSIAQFLRRTGKPVVVAVNKVDNQSQKQDVNEFYRLGFDTVLALSAVHGIGTGDLMDWVVSGQSNLDQDIRSVYKNSFHIAVVGRPNIGKSSLVNALVKDERMMVDNKAGTTRDTVEIYFEHLDQKYILLDTAGIRRKAKINDVIEYFSILRSDRSIQYADLVVLVLDSVEFMTDQDKKLINLVIENKRNMILFVNKCDLLEDSSYLEKDLKKIAKHSVPTLQYYPFVFGSALQKKGMNQLLTLIPKIIQRSQSRIDTPELNIFVKKVIDKQPPRAKQGKRLKVFYVTQAEISPPTFVFFVNEPTLVDTEYRRYLEKKFREEIGDLEGVAIRLKFRSRSKRE